MEPAVATSLRIGKWKEPREQALRVGISTTTDAAGFRAHQHRGTGRYVRELLRYFAEQTDSQVAVSAFAVDQALQSPVMDGFINCLPAGRATVKQQLLAPMRLAGKRTNHLDVLHFPAHIDAPSWCKKPYVVTVLDLIPVVLADLYRADKPSWRFQLARKLELLAIQNASRVLAISENTAKDVHRVLGIPYEKIVVTPLGVHEEFSQAQVREDEFQLRERYEIPLSRPVVLYVGGIDQRKNIEVMLQSFRLLLNRWQERRIPREGLPVLLMCGSISADAQYPKLEKLKKELLLEDHVCMPGFVPDEDLLQLYALSSVFFFPSLYEGFGLPPLEAMAAGLPVVSSNASCLPEVIGNAALSFSPTDEIYAAQLLDEVLTHSELSDKLREEGRRQAKKFTWERTGELTLDAYRQIM